MYLCTYLNGLKRDAKEIQNVDEAYNKVSLSNSS